LNFTYTAWLCRKCSKPYYDGYGCESKNNPDYEPQIPCEQCGTSNYWLNRFRIPEEDIRFEFVVSYRMWVGYHVKVDGKYITTESGSPKLLEYQGKLEDWKPGVWNYPDVKTYKREMGARENCLYWVSSDDHIPDEVFEAFKIMAGRDDTRRVLFHCTFLNQEKPVSEWEIADKWWEYY
jgi:hypothetical protein